MSLPTFKQTSAFNAGSYMPGSQNGNHRTGITGTLTLDGSHGASLGDIPSSLFAGALERVDGGINVGGTQFIKFVASPDGTSVLSLNASGVPTNPPADTYLITVTSVGN